MRVLCGYRSPRYVIRARVPIYDSAGRPIGEHPGISVRPTNSIIDTDAYANELGWDSDTKRMVEEHLLRHRDFGRKVVVDSGVERGGEPQNTVMWAMWFAPDQSFPEEHRGIIEQQQWFKAWSVEGLPIGEAETKAKAVRTCLARPEFEGTVYACTNEALEGAEYCSIHFEQPMPLAQAETDDLIVEPRRRAKTGART